MEKPQKNMKGGNASGLDALHVKKWLRQQKTKWLHRPARSMWKETRTEDWKNIKSCRSVCLSQRP